MARTAIFLPQDVELAVKIAKEKFHLNVAAAQPADHKTDMQALLDQIRENGIDVIIARGSLANGLRQLARASVIDVRVTRMEMLQLVRAAKAKTGKACPRIALVCSKNMIDDLDGLDEIAGAELVPCYHGPRYEEILDMAARAAAGGADALIGGEAICAFAGQNGLASALLKSGPEGIGEACRVASRVADAIDREKRNAAELRIVLDHAAQGLIQTDEAGRVQSINQSAQHMLDLSEQEAVGAHVSGLLPGLNAGAVAAMLEQRREMPPCRYQTDTEAFLVSGVPVVTENTVTGAVLSITEGRKLRLFAAEARRELIRQGYIAEMTFDTIPSRSPQARMLLEQARRYAGFDLPVLILGEFGTEKEELAQCIHNASDYAANAFVHFNCAAGSPERAAEALFGPGGLVEKAQGILFLAEVSQLNLEGQYLLSRLIAGRRSANYSGLDPMLPPLRVIASNSTDLEALVRQGRFREELWYALSVMTLRVPPLRQREKDVLAWSEFFFEDLQQRHGRYIHLTRGAWKYLMEFGWPGNQAQLYSVCQRIIVESPRRTVDEAFLRSLLAGDALHAGPKAAGLQAGPDDPEAAPASEAEQIEQLLRRHHGSRAAVANELGISTTTLWRHMKKYGFLK